MRGFSTRLRAWRGGRRGVDLGDPALFRDPGPVLAALAESGAVHRTSDGRWLVVDARLIHDALARPEDFSSRVWRRLDPTLFGADPPQHAAARRMIAPLLGPAAVDPLAEIAAEIAREVAAELTDRHEVDVIAELAEPVVHRTVTRVLGEEALGSLSLEPAPRETLGRALWFAATVTTVRHVGWAVLELDRHPRLREAVAAGTAMDAFLDEVLRLHPPEPLVYRVATRETRLGDAVIPRDARVVLAIAAPNRDPDLYPQPGAIRLDRPARATHSFGHGPHRCPGSRAARHMTRAAVSAVVGALPAHRVAEAPGDLHHVDPPGHGLARLTIARRDG